MLVSKPGLHPSFTRETTNSLVQRKCLLPVFAHQSSGPVTVFILRLWIWLKLLFISKLSDTRAAAGTTACPASSALWRQLSGFLLTPWRCLTSLAPCSLCPKSQYLITWSRHLCNVLARLLTPWHLSQHTYCRDDHEKLWLGLLKTWWNILSVKANGEKVLRK